MSLPTPTGGDGSVTMEDMEDGPTSSSAIRDEAGVLKDKAVPRNKLVIDMDAEMSPSGGSKLRSGLVDLDDTSRPLQPLEPPTPARRPHEPRRQKRTVRLMLRRMRAPKTGRYMATAVHFLTIAFIT